MKNIVVKFDNKLSSEMIDAFKSDNWVSIHGTVNPKTNAIKFKKQQKQSAFKLNKK